MNTPSRWPTDDELKQLLHGQLSGQRQAEIEAQLEQDELLRARLEQIAGGDSWIRRAGQGSGEATSAVDDFALQAAIDDLKGQSNAATMLQGAAGGSMTLSFLSPSDYPGAMGRLAHYEVLELIGCGGFGLVLRALDPKLNRHVAIKVLAPHLATHATARRRFTREAHTAASINHPHVVTIHAIDDNERTPFLVMEYVAGQSLQQLLDRQGPLDVAQILRIGAQTAAGLAAAHKQGQIHRDIKPANILLENGVQRVKITDFGLARAADDASLTQSGVIAGTPQYMAPEQARGETVDYRADLFSLGSVLYTMCTGRPAFRADSAVAVLKRVCDDQPRPIRVVNPEIPDWLVAIVERLMAKRRDERYQSAQEVSELLEKCLAHVQQPELVSLPEGVRQAPRPEPVSTSPSAPPAVPATRDRAAEIALASRLSRGPGIGLMVVGILNLVVLFAVSMSVTSHEVRGAGEGQATVAWSALVVGAGLLLAILSSATMIAGGIQLQRRQMWPLVLVAALLSMLTVGLCASGLIVGIWALIVLFDPRYQRGLYQPGDEELPRDDPAVPPVVKYPPPLAVQDVSRSAIRDKVWWPATCLLWIGALNAIAMVAGLLVVTMFLASQGEGMWILQLAALTVMLLVSVVIIAGAVQMRELRSWPLALTSAVLAMLMGPGSGIGFFIGLWALIVLMQADVRAAFAANSGESHVHVPRTSSSPATTILVVLLVTGGCLGLAGLLLCGGWVFVSSPQPQHLSIMPEPELGTLRIECDLPNAMVTLKRTKVVGAEEYGWETAPTAAEQPAKWEGRYLAEEYTVRAQDTKGVELFSQDFVLRAGEYKTVKVIRQVKASRLTRAWPGKGYVDESTVSSVALSPDGKLAAWILWSGEIVVCTTESGKEVQRFTTSDARLVVFSPDSKTIASLGAEQQKADRGEYQISLYNLETKAVKFLPLTGKHTQGRYKTLENIKAIAFSPDGQTVVASSAFTWTKQRETDPEFKSVIHRWRLSDSEELPPLLLQDGIIQHIAFPAGLSDCLATASNWSTDRGGTIVFWNLNDAKPLGTAHWERRIFDSLALTPQGGWVYASCYDPADVPGTRSGPKVAILATRKHGGQRGLFLEAGSFVLDDDRASSLAISPDGSVFAISKDQRSIELWRTDALRPTKLAELTGIVGGNVGKGLQLHFTADSKTLIAASFHAEVAQWDVTAFTTAGEQPPVESLIPQEKLPAEAPP